MLTKDAKIAVVGLGISGESIATWLAKHDFTFSMHDSRVDLKMNPELERLSALVPLYLGEFKEEAFEGCTHLFISPGLDPNTPFFNLLKKKGLEFGNDISLFGELAKAPIIGITGSNGKSTVTTLTGLMLEAAGLNVGVGGNLGTAALDLLDPAKNVYVLELSSFQLEIATNVHFKAATLLNLTPDHLDRHESIQAYHAAKHNIFNAADIVVINKHDPLSSPMHAGTYRNPFIKAGRVIARENFPCLFFSLDESQFRHEFGVGIYKYEPWLFAGSEPVLPISDLKIQGAHNHLNALAAMALASTMNVPLSAMRKVLESFEGLPHRAQIFFEKDNVTWVNDSKGTNTGATMATFSGLLPMCQGKMILILGGRGKGEDYAVLQTVASQCRAVLLMGEEAQLIESAIFECDVPMVHCQSLADVVLLAKKHAQSGDIVLFSPACTSLDMFENYKARGDAFMECVKQNA